MSEETGTVSRRSVLCGATIVAGSAAVLAGSIASGSAQSSAQSGKMAQDAAAYQSSPKNGQKCLDCSFFVSPSSCKLVDGNISPVGWCKFWAKKS
jgi:High potential iron-sulfur protein